VTREISLRRLRAWIALLDIICVVLVICNVGHEMVHVIVGD
jgi:hypothetical protein